MQTIYCFDKDSQLKFTCPEPLSFLHEEHTFGLRGSFLDEVLGGMPALYGKLHEGDRLGFLDIDGHFRLFEIDKLEWAQPESTCTFFATDLAVRELADIVIRDLRPTNVQAGMAVTHLLSGTDWSLGNTVTTGQHSFRCYYESAWSGLMKLREAFGVEIIPYFVFTNSKITGRKIDVRARYGEQRGRVFDLTRDLNRVQLTVDTSGIKTALYGRGKGEEIVHDTDQGKDSAYGRRITFKDVVWTRASGDPADKPAGQEWVGDSEALSVLSRDGNHRFDVAIFEDVTEPELLLDLTWRRLQEMKKPSVSVTASVQDMEALWGYAYDAVRLGDDVTLRVPVWQADITARVIQLERDYVHPEQTKLVIGDASKTTSGIVSSLQKNVSGMKDRSDVWDRSEAFDKEGTLPTDHLKGAIDTVNNQLLSTLSNWTTDPTDGSLIFTSTDGLSAMRLSGAGWQIADGKVGGVWNWRTAGDGKGIVADQVTTGTLQANLVKILGTERFFWDASNIHIIDPDDMDRQIRIGMYDGSNYGIAVTQDGGVTWQHAISFDGVHFSGSESPALYKVELLSSNGMFITDGVLYTIISAQVYRGAEDITDQIPASRFRWTRNHGTSPSDIAWGAANQNQKSFQVARNDFTERVTFRCDILSE